MNKPMLDILATDVKLKRIDTKAEGYLVVLDYCGDTIQLLFSEDDFVALYGAIRRRCETQNLVATKHYSDEELRMMNNIQMMNRANVFYSLNGGTEK